MGVENFRAEVSAPYVGGKAGEFSAKIGEMLTKPNHSALTQVLGAALMDFADPKTSIFVAANRKNLI